MGKEYKNWFDELWLADVVVQWRYLVIAFAVLCAVIGIMLGLDLSGAGTWNTIKGFVIGLLSGGVAGVVIAFLVRKVGEVKIRG